MSQPEIEFMALVPSNHSNIKRYETFGCQWSVHPSVVVRLVSVVNVIAGSAVDTL